MTVRTVLEVLDPCAKSRESTMMKIDLARAYITAAATWQFDVTEANLERRQEEHRSTKLGGNFVRENAGSDAGGVDPDSSV